MWGVAAAITRSRRWSGSLPPIHSSASASTASGSGSTAPVAAHHWVNGRVITAMSRSRYRFVGCGERLVSLAHDVVEFVDPAV